MVKDTEYGLAGGVFTRDISRALRMISEIRNNPNITSSQLASILGIRTTAVEKNIRFLKDNGCIERIGLRKNGYWDVKER